MWRAFFMAIGVILCILGLECLVVEKAVLAATAPTQISYDPYAFDYAAPPTPTSREFQPPEWAAWTLLSSGAVIILYSFSVRAKGG